MLLLSTNTTGANNTAVGWDSGRRITTGNGNITVGCCVLSYNTTGSLNTAVGQGAMICTTGSSDTAFGNAAGYNISTGSCNIVIGRDAGRAGFSPFGITTEDNRVVIGTDDTTNAYGKSSLDSNF
jgi:hypothetical protein